MSKLTAENLVTEKFYPHCSVYGKADTAFLYHTATKIRICLVCIAFCNAS